MTYIEAAKYASTYEITAAPRLGMCDSYLSAATCDADDENAVDVWGQVGGASYAALTSVLPAVQLITLQICRKAWPFDPA